MDELRPKFGALLGIPYSVDRRRRDVGATLCVGMGDQEWLLVYVPDPDRDDASVTSLGNPNAEGTVVFWFGDHTEMSRKYLIPRDAALQAVKAWVESGQRSDRVQWTRDLL